MDLTPVEKVLSQAWGGPVRLSLQSPIDDHPQVARLIVQEAPAHAPPTVMLKRWRQARENRYVPGDSSEHLYTDWAGMNFLTALQGSASLAPRVFAGDRTAGFFVAEELAGTFPLEAALWGHAASAATQALIMYGEMLGRLHSVTAQHFQLYADLRRQLSTSYSPDTEDFHPYFQAFAQALRRLGFALPPAARADLSAAAALLSEPGSFSTFTHGDPVFTNVIACQGRWRLIDFEAARFRHALLEGAFPRMLFPTSGLALVFRLPEVVWRQAEAAYRATLLHNVPIADLAASWGPGLAAACAFWVLSFCDLWLARALTGAGPADQLPHIRQCALARLELFIMTAREHESLLGLSAFCEALATDLRARWPAEDCQLPLYPAFA